MTDKRARLLSDLRQLGSMSSHGGSMNSRSTASRFADLMDSADLDLDLELSELREEAENAESDFSDAGGDESEDDSLEDHLALLSPRELEALGIDALRARQLADARRFFGLARLEWAERCAKSLAQGAPVQLDRAAVLDDWVLAKYLDIANEGGPFQERSALERQFYAFLERAARQAAAAARTQPHEPAAC